MTNTSTPVDVEREEILATYLSHDRKWLAGATEAIRREGYREVRELYTKFVPREMNVDEFFAGYYRSIRDVFDKRVRELKEKKALDRIPARTLAHDDAEQPAKYLVTPRGQRNLDAKNVNVLAVCEYTGIHYHEVCASVVVDGREIAAPLLDEVGQRPWNGNFYQSLEALIGRLEKEHPERRIAIDAVLLLGVLEFRKDTACRNKR